MQHPMNPPDRENRSIRHCEKHSDEAIQTFFSGLKTKDNTTIMQLSKEDWIASLCSQ
jgi:hypothetical protein